MRIVYFGSPQTAVRPLEALHEAGHDIALVVSGADKRRGRGAATAPTPVKAAAQRLNLDVTDDMRDVLDTGAELGVVVAYGRIIPNEILQAFPLVNIHFSLLPRWRGAAPIERAILSGDATTGVCLMVVAEGLDTGGIYRRIETEISPTDTAAELHDRLSRLGADMVVKALDEGLGEPEPQAEPGATYAHKLASADRELSPDMTSEQFTRVVRVGGAWTSFRGKRLKIHEARQADRTKEPSGTEKTQGALGRSPDLPPRTPGGSGVFVGDTSLGLQDGLVELIQVQPEGRPAMKADEWARGAHPTGERIGT